jgi:hypothetical protein
MREEPAADKPVAGHGFGSRYDKLERELTFGA